MMYKNQPTTHGGFLIEYCLVRLPPHFYAVALGLRYMPEFGFHYVQTSRVVAQRMESDGELLTQDKIYQLGELICEPLHQLLYATLAKRIIGSEICKSERILQIGSNAVS